MSRDSRTVHEVRGTVALAQEDRFRLQTEDGRSLLFTLGEGRAASIEELEALAGSCRMIRVRYRGEPEAGAVAERVRIE